MTSTMNPGKQRNFTTLRGLLLTILLMTLLALALAGCSGQQDGDELEPSAKEIKEMMELRQDYQSMVLQFGVELAQGDRLFLSIPPDSEECRLFAQELMAQAVSAGALNAGIYEQPLLISEMELTDEGLLAGGASTTCYVIINGTPMGASDRIKWTQIGVATQKWADQVFSANGSEAAAVPKDQRVAALWKKIYQCSGLWPFDQEENPVLVPGADYWSKQKDYLSGFSSYLNETVWTDMVMETASGTALHVPMDQSSRFYTISSLPNEAFYVTPAPQGISGTLVSSAPSQFQGQDIEGITLTFSNGLLTGYDASKGKDVLDSFVGSGDQITAYRVGLVPITSYVNQTGLIYYNDLFDTNRLCSISLVNLTTGQLMPVYFGTADLEVYGVTDQGFEIQFFQDGNWIPD